MVDLNKENIMENNYPLHEQIMYESIMDGCVFIGDEFISIIEGKLSTEQKVAVVESIYGYITNNCSIYGDSDPKNLMVEEEIFDRAIYRVLKEKKYRKYASIYSNIYEVGMMRAKRLRKVGGSRIVKGRKLGVASAESLGRAKDRISNAGTSFQRAGASIRSGLYRDAVGQAVRGGVETAGAGLGAAVAGGQKALSKYMKFSGKRFMNTPRSVMAAKKKKEEDRAYIQNRFRYV